MKVLFIILGIAVLLFVGNKAWLNIRQRLNYLTTISNLVEHSKDISYYCELKPELKYRFLSPAINCILGPDVVEESMNNPYTAFERIHPDDLPVLLKKVNGELEYDTPIIQRWKNDSGKYIWFEEYATPIYKNGHIVAIHGIIRNISDKIELQKQLEYKVSHDPLTSLYNRGYFETMMDRYDHQVNSSISILVFDLDDLKKINDRYGHKVGDLLIKEMADILKSYCDDDVIASRIGGDEFAVLLVNSLPRQAETFMAAIQREIDLLNSDESRLYKIHLSKGYAFYHSSLGKMEDLFIEADDQMYREKKYNKTYRLANSPSSVR
jgi:diguanylate cyclase (GGDEF)-like protein/PAS domain S-box-containing protein